MPSNRQGVYIKIPQYWSIIYTFHGSNIERILFTKHGTTFSEVKTLNQTSHCEQDAGLYSSQRQYRVSASHTLITLLSELFRLSLCATVSSDSGLQYLVLFASSRHVGIFPKIYVIG